LGLPNLLTLDLGFNLLIKIVETVENLVKLRNLKNLILMGNPFCLLKPYREYVLSQLKLLTYFDQEEIYVKDNSPLKKAISPFSKCANSPFNKGNSSFNKGNTPFNKGNLQNFSKKQFSMENISNQVNFFEN